MTRAVRAKSRLYVWGAILENLKRDTEDLMKAYVDLPLDDYRKKLDLLNKLTNHMYREGKFLLAAEMARAELPRFEEYRCLELANITNNMIKYCCLAGDYDSSIEYGLKALELFHQFGTADDINDVIANIGGVYIYMDQYEKGLEYTLRALEYAKSKNDREAASFFLNNCGIALNKLGHHDEAIANYEEAISIKLELGKKGELCNSYMNLAQVFLDTGNYSEAFEVLEKARPIAEEIGNLQTLKELSFHMADYYRRKGLFDEALELLSSYVEFHTEAGSLSKIPDALKEMADIHETIGELENALNDYKRLVSINERLYREASSARMVELESSFRVQQKMQEIEMLNSQNHELEEVKILLERRNRELLETQEKLEIANEMLKIQAETDPLTGLLNQKRMYPIIETEIDRALRYGGLLSMVMIDLDDFKKINDIYGHLIGDNVLKAAAAIVKNSIRRSDYAFRYGGEEFLLLLPSTDIENASAMANRLREEISSSLRPRVTLSAGVSTWKGEDATDFIRKTDALLYQAKENGKDRIVKEV